MLLLPGESVHEAYRPEAEWEKLNDVFRKWSYVNRARRLIIYGFSFGPLDAELALMLGMGFDDAEGGEVWIVNPRDWASVERRVRALIPKGSAWKVRVVPPGRVEP
jgi:hypothetical protein